MERSTLLSMDTLFSFRKKRSQMIKPVSVPQSYPSHLQKELQTISLAQKLTKSQAGVVYAVFM